MSASSDISYKQRALWILSTFYYQILAILTLLLFWILFENYNASSVMFWHILLSTAAYVPLMAVAIILFSEDNVASLYVKRTKKYWIHGVLLGISGLAVTIGISVEINAKGSRPHFKSNHAILGLVSWVLVLVSIFIGLVAAKTKIVSSFIRPVWVKLIHNFLGIAGFAIGVGSLYLELSIVSRYGSEHLYVASKWLLWIVTALSLLAAFKSLWGQIKSVFS